LSETLTYNKIKHEILKTANDRIIDPPPSYISIENSSELTKQIEVKELTEQEREKTKQEHEKLEQEREKTEQEREKTKQKQLELEIKKFEFEMMKFNKNI
jgi:copper homeostasis protein CutC